MAGHWHYIVWGFVGLVMIALDLVMRKGAVLEGFNWWFDAVLLLASIWSFAIGFRKWNQRIHASVPVSATQP